MPRSSCSRFTILRPSLVALPPAPPPTLPSSSHRAPSSLGRAQSCRTTRAAVGLDLFAFPEVFHFSVNLRCDRGSGLDKEHLWQPPPPPAPPCPRRAHALGPHGTSRRIIQKGSTQSTWLPHRGWKFRIMEPYRRLLSLPRQMDSFIIHILDRMSKCGGAQRGVAGRSGA